MIQNHIQKKIKTPILLSSNNHYHQLSCLFTFFFMPIFTSLKLYRHLSHSTTKCTSLDQYFLNFSMPQNHLQALIKHTLLGFIISGPLNCVGLGGNLSICKLENLTFPCEVDAASLRINRTQIFKLFTHWSESYFLIRAWTCMCLFCKNSSSSMNFYMNFIHQ